LSLNDRLLQAIAPFRMVHPMVLDVSCTPAVVLIVEDEMMLRMLAVDMVEHAGYTPVEAMDADEAIAILESRSDIALMCTDIEMPGSMDGLVLAYVVHERWPSIKIIVVSGKLSASSIDLPPCSKFFSKPVEARQMIPEMRSMIGQV
jgi:DNA-binding NtrC family response regulator